ncbi:phospho-sugar mutase [Suttonella ornithocola]|uniref:Probable phosphomannomutase n=1 Tax=Suttonella ornithocola TaxID=279832 RepID=A0A380MVD1_9GAMM|nr:phospho-sugar mutase [Suttonella ornithocola]SUO96232.1 Probable phosphomannomutase [Suttonella ornithocola]
MTDNLLSIAQHWLEQDPDTETREELQAIINNNNTEELHKRFHGRLQFGTAGLRGPLQAGSMGMNRVLVAQAAGGLAAYLKQKNNKPSVVIGCDARKNSYQFAKDSAEILQGAGVTAYLLPEKLPTPVLAYAVRKLGVSAGIMVTASHNPPEDNGYKVYLGDADDGAQIVPPADSEIASEIEKIAQGDIRDLPRDNHYQQLDNSVWEDYIATTALLANQTPVELNYIYTAMHGVGKNTFLKTLEKANYPLPHLVSEQCDPDPTFPTVNFPNPEEAGALDLAIIAANYINADFILANDPDADRLAVALKDAEGNWKPLHGNTVGCWLAWEAAKAAQSEGKQGTLACSLVSSPQLAKIAKAYDLVHEETLTGFKWIGRVPNLLFGYEEALGYLVDPQKVHDKDGISAAMAFLNLALRLKHEGKTFIDYANEYTEKFGAAASGQVSIRVTNLSRIGEIMTEVRNSPPQTLVGLPVIAYTDHLQTERNNNILVFHIEKDGEEARVIFRPSGTEPKLKIYLDTGAPTQAQADALLEKLISELKQTYTD